MKKKVEIKRKRIIIYYILAIVLPCLILGALAFRGIKNDQALVEREQRRNLTEISQQIIRETDSNLSKVERSFTEITDQIEIPREIIFTDSILNKFSGRNQAVGGIFYISDSGDLFLLNNGFLFVPDNLFVAADKGFSQRNPDIFNNGWQFEYRETDYPKALNYYQTILQNFPGRQPEGEILNAIARLQKKMNLEDEAIMTYDRIWNEYPQVLIQNKIPLGTIALLEKSLLYLTKKDTIATLRTVYQLLSQIQKSRWELVYSHYTNLLSKTDEIISLCESSGIQETRQSLQKVNALKDSLSLSERQTEYLLSFLDSGEPSFGNSSSEPLNGHRYKTQIKGESYLYSLIPADEKGQWGLIMDPDYIQKEILYVLLVKNLRESGCSWQVTDANGSLLLKSGNIPGNVTPIYAVFPSNLPSWTLTLFPSEKGVFTSLFRPGRSVFLYIFIAIVVILACGLFFTLQTVNNELNLSRMKSYFMSTVSHEFKSPLTSIRQMAEMLVHERVPTPERKQKYYSTILQQSERLSHLIDNILDFTKMEEGHKVFHFEKADVVPVVNDIIELFRELMASSGFKISLKVFEPLPDIVFDREAVEQMVYNLIDNACKYSGGSKVIDIQLTQEDGYVIISVRDYGVGIRKEDQEKIFSRFYRAGEELTHNVKGSGIGLAIVKQIVEAHHGVITVESEVGKGSRFVIRLPLDGK